MDFLTRHIRAVILVLGFASSVLGTLGSLLFIDSLNKRVTELTDQREQAIREIDKLDSLINEYFIANQQGDLIFTLGLTEGARYDLISLIYQGNMLDRASPMSSLIGEMALNGLLNYRATYDEYDRLIEAAMQSGDYRSFVTVKAYEREVVLQAQAFVAELVLVIGPHQQEITRSQAELRQRNLYMFGFSSFGAFLLLLANLVEHRRRIRQAVEDVRSMFG